jgi:hypothetical protein
MEYEVFQVKEDGSKLEVPADKINDALAPSNVVILIDHTRRKIYNFNGKESSIRVRFIGARMAAGPIRGELGLTYTVASVDEGEETNDFRDCLKKIGSPGSAAVSRILDRPPPPPPPMRSPAPKASESVRRQTPEPTNDLMPTDSSSFEKQAPILNSAVVQAECDVSLVIKEFGEPPEGYDVEAVIVRDSVFKNVKVQTKVFGKEVEQTKLERVNDIDGLFTMDGEVKVIAKNGVVQGVQILSKQNSTLPHKSKHSNV